MFTLGCSPDPVDPNDINLRGFLDTTSSIPTSLSIREKVPVFKNQGRLSVCVGEGCTTVKETIDNMNGEFGRLSSLWLYDQCKRRDGDPYGDGTYIRIAMKVMAQMGVMPYNFAPFDGVYVYGKYDNCTFDESLARPYRIRTYARLAGIDDMCRCLVQHGPFAMGIQVTDEFEYVGTDGYVPIHYKKVNGGHCIAVVGYNLEEQTLLIVNSWGTNWGELGCAKLPFAYWERFGMDAWGIVDISPNEA